MELDNKTFMDIADLEYRVGMDTICELLSFEEETVFRLLTDSYSLEEVADEFNKNISEIKKIKDNVLNKIQELI